MTQEQIKVKAKEYFPNDEFKQQIVIDAINWATKELEKENAELEEEKAELERARDYWRSSSFDWRRKCVSRKPFKVVVKAQEQLSEAKEIIREFMKYEINEYDGSLEIHFEELKKQADQFISEVEK